ncbi:MULTISPECIES: HlyD family efflux transporter periplasmic adaptor subunit [Tatumella]|uniref:HlyD family secretion protein n=2 Tax=Tatumella ptyseos TaxID=82987 RepID=A0A085JL45_9GAMM|nr:MULTISPECIES: HlyD family efflux transporter periplasmic adaptor subunit [Tatumella]KFD21191.1 HlyD family secretion protein [Tatumella ptyseos ATCC 33301]SQK77112.1 Hemolysin secretion protein D, chromosomal [Tatumella ptyseos]
MKFFRFRSAAEETSDDAFSEVSATSSVRMVITITLFLVLFFIWAWFCKVDEVSNGPGQVIPTLRDQKIQSRDGGVLTDLYVHEGEIVDKGSILAQLDPTQGESSLDESAARYRAVLAAGARLRAEASGADHPVFPAELNDYPQLIQSETALFNARRKNLADTLSSLNSSLSYLTKQINITRSLLSSGAASQVDLLKEERDRADLQLRISDAQTGYQVKTQEELSKADAEIKALQPVVAGRQASLNKLTLRAPVRGIIKSLDVTTIGGVIPPNGTLMSMVPLDDQLLVEARISPRDIAFIRPGLEAKVKVTAYDYSIYGGLKGKVVTISPDTIRDEVKPENIYYRVFVLTDSDSLVNARGKHFPIVPGMVTSTDIKTGSRTIWDYLTKPLNKVNEALHER